MKLKVSQLKSLIREAIDMKSDFKKGDPVNNGRKNYTFMHTNPPITSLDGSLKTYSQVLGWSQFYPDDPPTAETYSVETSKLHAGQLPGEGDAPTIESWEKQGEAYDLAEYVIKNWKKLTGLPRSEMHQESSFPQVIEDLCAKKGIDLQAFSDAFNEILEH